MNQIRRVLLSLLVSGLGGLLLAGCAGWDKGPRDVDFKSVAVPVFRNHTKHPRLEVPVTNGLLRRLQADGTLKVKWADEADVVVSGTVLSYERHVLRTLPTDSRTPREYRLVIEILVEAKNRRTGKVVLSPTRFTGQTDSFLGSDLQSAEEQAWPLIAEDLARQVVAQLTETW